MLRHRNEYPVEATLPASAFDGATTWINSPPLTAEGLRGRVVLASFGTYTCINWIRSSPYVRAWADKYADKGLVVVGINTPEFEFEGNLDNVERALKEMDVRYPVAVDNDYAVWQAFDNHYWPALYFVDAEGNVRHHHFGEGEYEESEMVLQMLLRAAGTDVDQGLVEIVPDGYEKQADWYSLGTAETYLPDVKPGGSISIQFHARDLHLVMGPPLHGGPVRFRVTLNGEPPGPAAGLDVDEDGNGTADYQRMYQLIRQPGPVDDRLFRIEFLDAGVEAFVFTFG